MKKTSMTAKSTKLELRRVTVAELSSVTGGAADNVASWGCRVSASIVSGGQVSIIIF